MNFGKFVRTPFFAEHHETTASIIVVSTVNYSRKKTTSQMFDWVENKLQAKGLKYCAHSCSQSAN